MTTTAHRPTGGAPPPRTARRAAVVPPARPPLPWAAATAAAASVLLAGAPVTAIVQGSVWPVQAAMAVLPVSAVGLALHRRGPAVVGVGQLLTVLALLTLLFADEGVFGLLPGPAAFGEFGDLLQQAGGQIDTSVAPVLATTEIRFLVFTAFALFTVAVSCTAVTMAAPAAAGVPLLAVFAVPAALADDLLPWWTVVAAAAGFGALLLSGSSGTGRQRVGTGVGLLVVSLVAALGAGAGTGFVGTAGRFEGGGVGAGSANSIGLSPFTSLRGQLDQSNPVELFRVRGLGTPTYLRALTLREYVPGIGWQASPPVPDTVLPGQIPGQSVGPGDIVDIEVENVAFRDYWLPVYGEPLDVGGLTGEQWKFDTAAGIAFSVRPRAEDGWRQRALLPTPTADDLRAASGPSGIGREYLDSSNVDARVQQLAEQITAASGNAFDRALALQNYFAGPGSEFRYSLQTVAGNGDDALVEFLTVGRAGYCEQFASAMATMLRTVGVPSRVAVGFTGGTEVGDHRTITTQDAHAWVEAWFPGYGWITFDPTPLTDGRSITPPYVEQGRGDPAGGEASTLPNELSPEDQLPDQQPLPPQLTDGLPPPAAAPVPAADSGPPLWPFGLVLLALAAAATPFVLRALLRRRRLAEVHAGGAAAAWAAWTEVLATSLDRQAPMPATDTVRGTARRLVREHRLTEPTQQSLRTLVTAVEASWYGGGHPEPGQLDEPVHGVLAGISDGSRLTPRQRVFPRSITEQASGGRGLRGLLARIPRARIPWPRRSTGRSGRDGDVEVDRGPQDRAPVG